MSSKSEKDRAKQIQDRCQNILMQMLKDEDNKYCVDCDAKGPRWASWNLGIFLCIRCAGIHRNLGVHISKVKSVNLDSWTPEQVVSLQQMGNSRARAVYEANLPDSFRRPQNDSALEAFIRAKYEHKKYIAKEWVPPPAPSVNWDKEIDEELDRQKRKKKSTSSGLGPLPAPSASDKKYNKSDVIPSIPKPKSSVSPKLGRSTPTNTTESKTSNCAADLLGLDTTATKTEAKSDDIFSSFFSAPQEKPAEAKQENTKPDLKTEEENFFKQPTPSEKEKSKLTKDSILALYSQTPSTNLNQFNPQTAPNQFNQTNFAQPATNFAQPATNFAQPATNFAQPATNFAQPATNFAQPATNFAQPATNFAQPPYAFGTYQAPAFNSVPAPAQNGMPQFNQFQAVPGQFQQPFAQPPLQQPFPSNQQNQQFFNQQQPLAQQFGSLNLGQSFPNAFAPNANVASNTWQ